MMYPWYEYVADWYYGAREFFHETLKPWFCFFFQFFFRLVSTIHQVTGSVLGNPVEWQTLWGNVAVCEEVSVVVRIVSTMGAAKRVEGFVSFQQCGSLFRLHLDGYEVVTDDFGNHGKGPSFYGAIYFPESIKWKLESMKVKGMNTSSIRGRTCAFTFDRNPTGYTTVQVTVLRNNQHSIVAKEAASHFDKVMNEAKETNNKKYK